MIRNIVASFLAASEAVRRQDFETAATLLGQGVTGLQGYNPDQPRDERGRWGAGGGEGGQGSLKSPIVVTNEQDAENALKKVSNFGNAAIGLYEYTKQGNYSRINTALRQQSPLDPTDRETVKMIDSGLKKLPAYQGVAYRGVSLIDQHGKLQSAEDVLRQYEVGKTFTEPTYFSSSTRESVMRQYQGISGVKIAIKTKGERARAVLSKSPHPDEHEILFERGTQFKVLRKEIGKTAAGLSQGLLVLEEL